MSPCGHGQSFGQLPVPVNADLAQSLVNALRQSAQQAEAPGWGGGSTGRMSHECDIAEKPSPNMLVGGLI